MNELCGLKGCLNEAAPGLYVEFVVPMFRKSLDCRVKVCRTHHDLIEAPPAGVSIREHDVA